MEKKPLYQREFANLKSFEMVLDHFRDKFKLHCHSEITRRRLFYDTFDWRLYRNGYVLERDLNGKNVYRLRSTGRDVVTRTFVLDQDPDFSWNFKRKSLRDLLSPLISIRRLMVKDEVNVRIQLFELIDKRKKIQLRFELEKYLKQDSRGRNRNLLINCRFYPLRGYEGICNKQLKWIDKNFPLPGRFYDPVSHLLSAHNIKTTDYSSKLNLTLSPDMSIGQAMATTLLFHLDMIDQNLPGVKADLDSEFLHDFRIANRRSRSLLTQIKRVLPENKEKYYRQIFSWLSNETSEPRDLDVFILDIPRYESMLPVDMQAGLEPLRIALSGKRQKAHDKLLKTLNSAKFKKFMTGYRASLMTGLKDHFRTRAGIQPVLKEADQVIWRVYNHLLKKGRYARETGDKQALHDLRKTGKKLRYLLETFRSLYPEKEIEQVVSQCRRLQNLLGRIVDYRVQQNYLLSLTADSIDGTGFPRETAICIQYLVDTYGKLEEKAIGKFDGRFTQFSETQTRKLFERLFTVKNT